MCRMPVTPGTRTADTTTPIGIGGHIRSASTPPRNPAEPGEADQRSVTRSAQRRHSSRTAATRRVWPLCGLVFAPCAVCLHERCQRALPPCSRPHSHPEGTPRMRSGTLQQQRQQAGRRHTPQKQIKIKVKVKVHRWYRQSPLQTEGAWHPVVPAVTSTGGRCMAPGRSQSPRTRKVHGTGGTCSHQRRRKAHGTRWYRQSPAPAEGAWHRGAAGRQAAWLRPGPRSSPRGAVSPAGWRGLPARPSGQPGRCPA
jgi:hypothetical protein